MKYPFVSNVRKRMAILWKENLFSAFWRNLRLTRKLFLVFSTIALLALVVGIVANLGLNSVQSSYEKALLEGKQMEFLSAEVNNDLLTARQLEKDFLVYWTLEGYDVAYEHYVIPHQAKLVEIREHLDELDGFASIVNRDLGGQEAQTNYETNLKLLRENLDLYELNFQKAVKASKEKGFQDTGLAGKFNIAVQSIEDRIYSNQQENDQSVAPLVTDDLGNPVDTGPGLDSLVITLLQIRRNEKDYLLSGDQAYIDNVNLLTEKLKEQSASAEQLDQAERIRYRELVERYQAGFEAVVAKNSQINKITSDLNDNANNMNPLVSELNSLGAELSQLDVAKAKTNSSQTLVFSTITLIAVLLFALILAVILPRQITQPVLMLTSATQEFEAGNYDAHAEVTSGDEIGQLAYAFNHMTGQLKTTMASLAKRTQMLAASTDVSRRLSSLLVQDELIKAVVDLVQSSFNYYHTQIYLLDETTGEYSMAGGSGKVGELMLAEGFRIPRGKGLVGRAAETNTLELVSDTKSNPNWLPNPLLPDTRAEVVVPISIGNQVLGVLDVQQNEVGGLNQDDTDLLLSIANQVAVALRNSRSYTEVQVRAEREALLASINQKILSENTVESALRVAVREVGRALGSQARVKLTKSENQLEKNSAG